MKQIKLSVSNREKLGGNNAKRYRKANKIPAVIYGESGEKNLLLDAKEFSVAARQISGIAALLDISFDDGTESRYAMVKSVERNPITDAVLHVDFIEVVRGKPMLAVVPIHVTGEAFGVKNENAVLEQHLHEMKIKCRPRDLPEFIEVDVSNMHLGDLLTLADLKLPEGVTLDMDGERTVVTCDAPMAEEVAPAEPAAEAAPAEGDAKAAAPAADAKPAEAKK